MIRLVTGTIEVPAGQCRNAKTDTKFRRADQFSFGTKVSSRLQKLFGENSAIAATTCRFQFHDRRTRKNSNTPGRRPTDLRPWELNSCVQTTLQTFGIVPAGFQRNGQSDWIVSNNTIGADQILQCFDLTTRQVLEFFGGNHHFGKMTLDLDRIVKQMKPHLMK